MNIAFRRTGELSFDLVKLTKRFKVDRKIWFELRENLDRSREQSLNILGKG